MWLWQAVVEYHGLDLDLNLLSPFVLVSQFPSFVKWGGGITVPNPQHGFAVKQRQLVGLTGQGLPRVGVISGGAFAASNCLRVLRQLAELSFSAPISGDEESRRHEF